MNIFQRTFNLLSGRANEIKYLSPQNRQEMYNELNRELYRFINSGNPHIIDANATSYINEGYTYNSLLYSIINYMITTASQVKWKLELRNGDKVDEIFEHEFLDLWNEPNEFQTITEFIEEVLLYKFITGNTYIYGPKLDAGQRAGKVVKLQVMPSQFTTPIFGSYSEPVSGYRFLWAPYTREIPVDRVIHIKYSNPDISSMSPAIGLSPVKALLLTLSQNNDAWMNLAKSFKNGGPVGFISKDGTTPDTIFTKDMADQLIERLVSKHAGPHRANTFTAIGGNAKWNQMGLSPVDLKILEAIQVTFIQICNVYKFPAPLLNFDKVSTYNNWTESQRVLWTNALMPELNIIGQKVTNRYLKPGAYGEGLTLKPDYSGIEALQSNKKEQAEWLNTAWWIKGSRKQELMGEDVDLEMDKYFLPMGLTPFDELPTMDQVNQGLGGVQDYKP